MEPAKPEVSASLAPPDAASPNQSAPTTIPARAEDDVKLAPPANPGGRVRADARRQGDAVRITFPFAQATPAAMFRRADTIWLVFDSEAPIDISQIVAQSGRGIRSAVVSRSSGGQVVQLKLDRPKLTSAGTASTWTVIIGDTMIEPKRCPLSAARGASRRGARECRDPVQAPQALHRLSDGEIGDTLLVVTALGPARGF